MRCRFRPPPPSIPPSLPSKSTSYSLAEPSSSLRREKGALLLWRTTKRGSEQEARGRDKFDLCPPSPSFSLLLLLPRRPRLVFFRSGWREKRFPLSSSLASQSVPFPQRMIHFSAVRSGPEFYSERQNGMVFFPLKACILARKRRKPRISNNVEAAARDRRSRSRFASIKECFPAFPSKPRISMVRPNKGFPINGNRNLESQSGTVAVTVLLPTSSLQRPHPHRKIIAHSHLFPFLVSGHVGLS